MGKHFGTPHGPTTGDASAGGLGGVVRVAIAFFPLILGFACGGEDIKPRLVRPGNTGTIEGRILTVGGTAPRPWVRAETPSEIGDQPVIIQVRADSSGAYSLLVPFGLYVLSTQVEGGVRLYYGEAGLTTGQKDTFRIGVGQTQLHADFPLGRAEVTIDTPGVPESSMLQCTFFRYGQVRFEVMGRASARVSDGRVVFVDLGLPAGTFGLRLDTPWGEQLTLSESSLPASGDSGSDDDVAVTVLPGQVTQVHLALSPPAVLSGIVDGAWRDLNSLDDAPWRFRPDVRVHGRDSTRHLVRSEASDDGSFRLYMFQPDSVRLALVFGPAPQWWGGTTFGEAAVHVLAAGHETVVPPFTDAAIVLRLSAPEPLATYRGYVTVWDVRRRSLTGSQMAAGGSGNLSCLVGLAPGTVYLRAGPPGTSYGRDPWLRAWYPGVTSFDQAVPITLRPGEIVRIETPLIRGGVIQGRFAPAQADDGSARLDIFSVADTTRWFCSAEVSEGERTFRFVGLEDGAFLLRGQFRVSSRLYREWYAGAAWAGHADTLRVRDRGTIEITDWR